MLMSAFFAGNNADSVKTTTIYYVDDSFCIVDALPFIQNISSYEVADDCEKYASIDGVLYSKDLTCLVSYPPRRIGDTYQINDHTFCIGKYAFFHSKLRYIDMPNIWETDMTEIDDYAFYCCTNLRQIFIPHTINKLGENIFWDCASNLSIIVEKDSPAYQAFWEFANIVCLQDQYNIDEWVQIAQALYVYPQSISDETTRITEGVLFQGKRLIAYPQRNERRVYTIPEDTISVIAPILLNSNLQTLMIPASCEYLSLLQDENTSLQEYIVAKENKTYKAIDGVLFSKDEKILYSYPANKIGESYVIPESVATLYSECFAYSRQVKKVTLQEGAKEIGLFAFDQSSIEVITLPVSVEVIEFEAFENCPNLSAIYVVQGSYAEEFIYDMSVSINLLEKLHILP